MENSYRETSQLIFKGSGGLDATRVYLNEQGKSKLLTADKIKKLKDRAFLPSLDVPVGDDFDKTFVDTIEDGGAENDGFGKAV